MAVRTARVAVPRAAIVRAAHPTAIARCYATERDGSVSIDNPAAAEAQQLLEHGTAALELGDFEKAKADYSASLRVHNSASAHYNLGVVKYQEHDLAGAIAEWNTALEIAPDSPDAHTNIASAYIMTKPSRPDLAVSHLRPDDPEIHFNLAAVLEACEQIEDAIRAYKAAYDGGIENIRNCAAKLAAARLAVESEKRERAEKTLDEASEGVKNS